jgi:hypothetical protein
MFIWKLGRFRFAKNALIGALLSVKSIPFWQNALHNWALKYYAVQRSTARNLTFNCKQFSAQLQNSSALQLQNSSALCKRPRVNHLVSIVWTTWCSPIEWLGVHWSDDLLTPKLSTRWSGWWLQGDHYPWSPCSQVGDHLVVRFGMTR